MSEIMDDETLHMYVEESQEHLETIESDLLEIEQQGKDIDEDLVNKVFRAAHSIKGGGGFLGLDNIKELAHKIENVLDMIRNYQMVPTPDIVNTVLVAFDYLGEMLGNSVDSNEMDIADHVVALEGLASSNLAAEEKESIHQEMEIHHRKDEAVFTVTEFDINQARKGGKNIYILEFDLIKDVHRRDKTPLDIIKSLEDAGVILDIKIGISAVGDLDSEDLSPRIPMYVVYASIIEPDLIGTMMDLDNDRIQVVPQDSTVAAKLSEVVDGKFAPIAEETPKEVLQEEPGAEAAEPVSKAIQEEKSPKEPPEKKPAKEAKKTKPGGGQAESLRVPVMVLDQLMNRAGELVLARNQLMQSISSKDIQTVIAAGQRIDMVTSELQEAIMLTRMQPVGNIFNKFPRVVRDLARDLGKNMELNLEGKEVELDKTIIEGLGDPLTHLVRNSADHGIEMPDERERKGKPVTGQILLRAFHESGQVLIEIIDDGKGLDPEKIAEKAISKGLVTEEQSKDMSEKEKVSLIMLPGFSMAEEVTDVSGRGVGMDVVKTNLDKMGGHVEIVSKLGVGTTIRIKLPLTLAIIPSLLASSCGERFALPQVNVGELLRIPVSEVREKIEKIGEADVLILRGELIPLLQLGNVLGLRQTYYDPKSGEFLSDRREGLVDERLVRPDTPESDKETVEESAVYEKQNANAPERRKRRVNDVNIVVLNAGTFKYGLVVDTVHDTVEIVVKPLGRHLKNCGVYVGATIMGDGHVALILDVSGLARRAKLQSLAETESGKRIAAEKKAKIEGATRQTLLLFRNGPEEYCSVPLQMVLRVEQIKASDIELMGGKKVIQYRGGTLPVYALEEAANVEMLEEREKLAVILFVVSGHKVGLLVVPPLDILELDFVLDEQTLQQPGISGSAIIRDHTTLMVDIFGIMQALNPDWFEERKSEIMPEAAKTGSGRDGGMGKPILLVEDSPFFRAQVKQFMKDEGYAVVEAEDGREAWEYLNEHPDGIGLVVTDLEMPNMDGFELTRHIKGDERFAGLTVIALTSLAGEEDVAKGNEVGIDDYQIKLDKEKLLAGIFKCIRKEE
ncbi:MAG: chemotaxis protein CheW [Thermodesulfobacteriota bacterium]|nr:chemotaxis protein CheW [Thermodesulfobacteriota bacterium]